jgi:hypothetical protein
MTPFDKVIRSFEKEDRAAYIGAIQEIRGSQNLRALIRYLYEACGMANDPFTGDALTTAHKSGKMSVGVEFFGLINILDPSFLPTLMQELNDVRNRRSAVLDTQRRDD